jgi:GntR family transcriptional regulator
MSNTALRVTLVEHSSPIPAYVQVEQDLRRLIRSGDLVRVPPEVELAGLYGVSRVTVRQSLQRLATAGLIKREHGRGTTVVQRQELALDLGLFRSVTEQLREAGHRGGATILDQRLEVPPADVATALHMRGREKAVLLRRLVTANDAPISINTSWFPAKLVRGMEKASLDDASVWEYLAKRHQLVLTRTDNKVEVIESGIADAELLQVRYSSPLIKLMTCFSNKDGLPVEYSVSLWRSTQMRLSFSLTA